MITISQQIKALYYKDDQNLCLLQDFLKNSLHFGEEMQA